MLPKALILLASAAGVLSAPAGGACSGPKPTPTLPSTGAPTQLTDPPSNLKLKHIALGFGVQNYTCKSTDSPADPAGALAMLYDIVPFYPGQGASSLSMDAFAALPAQILSSQKVPLNFNPSKAGRVKDAHLGADATEPFPPAAPLVVDGLDESLRFIGHHFFNADGVPTFELDNGAITLYSKKDEAILAPEDADAGPDGTGAVGWLKLSDQGGSEGATLVYRVFTAGGSSHGCADRVGDDSTSYTAMYWFYG